jgi:hypothetical protein
MAIDTENQNNNDSEMPDFLNDFAFDSNTSPEDIMNIAGADNITFDADGFNVDEGGMKIDDAANINFGGATLDQPTTSLDEPPPAAKVQVPDLPPDFYTLLLGLALTAIIIASVLLFLEVNSYGPDPLAGLPRI